MFGLASLVSPDPTNRRWVKHWIKALQLFVCTAKGTQEDQMKCQFDLSEKITI